MKKITHTRSLIKQKKSVAVLGSNGMLGSDVVRFLSQFYTITPINRTNYSQHKGNFFYAFINANGNSKRFWANNYPLKDFMASAASVYKSVFDFKYNIYIYISSSDVYENHGKTKYTRERELINFHKLSSYGFHKYISEMIVNRSVKNYLILRSSMILGKNLNKGPFYDILQDNPLFITKNSKLQLITTEEIACIIHFLLNKGICREVFNVGGIGSFSFENIHQYVNKSINFSKGKDRQEYEMNVSKLQKIYPLKTSEEYLQDFLNNL